MHDRSLQLNLCLIVGMEFTIDSCVQRHHIFKEFWTPEVGEELACQREEGNLYDVYAVTVKADAGIVYRGQFWQPVLCFCVRVVQ